MRNTAAGFRLPALMRGLGKLERPSIELTRAFAVTAGKLDVTEAQIACRLLHQIAQTQA